MLKGDVMLLLIFGQYGVGVRGVGLLLSSADLSMIVANITAS